MAEFVASLVDMVVNFVVFLPTILISGINFIVFIFVQLPSIITNDMFRQLPFVFQYGLAGALGVVILITVLKLWALIRG